MNEIAWLQNMLGTNPAILWLLFAWISLWKGLSLWKASQKKQKVWFVALLVINTVGILEILYLFVFSEWKKKEKEAGE